MDHVDNVNDNADDYLGRADTLINMKAFAKNGCDDQYHQNASSSAKPVRNVNTLANLLDKKDNSQLE